MGGYLASAFCPARVAATLRDQGDDRHRPRDLLQTLDALTTATGDERARLQDRLALFHAAAQNRVRELRDQLDMAGGFARQIQQHMARHS